MLTNEAQLDQNNNYGTMLFMSKQISLPKISSILQKLKITKNRYMSFLMKAFNYQETAMYIEIAHIAKMILGFDQ